jgi:hypothetical protein
VTLAFLAHARPLVPAPRPRYVGVYFLLDGDTVVYVGQSIDIEMRIPAHLGRRRHRNPEHQMCFDSVLWIEVEESNLTAYEGAFIRALNPRYNTKASGRPEADAAILALFGLAPDPARAFETRTSARFADVSRRMWREKRRRTLKRASRLLNVRRFLWDSIVHDSPSVFFAPFLQRNAAGKSPADSTENP